MARVPPPGASQEPLSSSPIVPTGLQRHSGWLGILKPTCELGPRLPLSFTACSRGSAIPSAYCMARVFLFQSLPRGLCASLCSLPTQATKAAGLVPCVPAPSGLSAHLSMCLLGLVVKCVLLSRGCCLGSSSSCSTVTFHTHPRGSMVGLGRPTHIHSHSGSKSSTWPKKVHIEVPNPTCGPTPLSCLCLPSMSIVRLFLVPCDGGPHTHSSSLL